MQPISAERGSPESLLSVLHAFRSVSIILKVISAKHGRWENEIAIFFFFLFIWNPASSLTTIRTETSARDSIRFVFRSQIAVDRFFTKQILYRLTYDSNYIRSKYKNHIYILCIYTHKIEFNFVINRVRLHDRFHEIFAPFPRRSLRIDREKRSRPRFKIRQNSWCWILD